jgi:N-dimethylarginine dimethylaminohydrolase
LKDKGRRDYTLNPTPRGPTNGVQFTGVVIIGAEHKRLIREIEKREVLVVAVPFDKPSELGGGIRCSTHPLFRET